MMASRQGLTTRAAIAIFEAREGKEDVDATYNLEDGKFNKLVETE